MAQFSYKAVTPQGRVTDGQLDAPDRRAVTLKIQSMGLIPVAVEEAAVRTERRHLHLTRITRKDILFFTEELATLVRAGLPIDRSLSITAELASKPALRAIILDVLKRIKGGNSLAESLAAHPRQFDRLYVNMIRAGEAGGVLDVILDRLVEFEQAADELRSYMIGALIYPALLTTVGLASVGILMYFVIPRFAAIFEDVGAAVPPATMALLRISEYSRNYWWVALLSIGASVLSIRLWLKTPAGSRSWDSIKLKLPLLGPTLLKIEVARFAKTLGTLIASAVPLIAAVRIVQDIARNQLIAEGISRIADGAKRGEGVAKPMRDARVFPGLAVHLVEVGEETGRLDAMLLQVAGAFEKDVRTSIKALTSVFEPAIILVMGVIVGTVVLSMLMAIFSINDVNF